MCIAKLSYIISLKYKHGKLIPVKEGSIFGPQSLAGVTISYFTSTFVFNSKVCLHPLPFSNKCYRVSLEFTTPFWEMDSLGISRVWEIRRRRKNNLFIFFDK